MVLFQDQGRTGTAGLLEEQSRVSCVSARLLWNCLTKFPFFFLLGRQTEKHTRALGKAGFM